jgi:hypothetical protein
MYLHALLLVFCSAYQIVAIFFFPGLIRYRFHVSRFNKICLVTGVYGMVYLHVYRLSQPGQLCSGDFLSAEQRSDPQIADRYLIERGHFLKFYITAFWFCLAVIVATLVYIGKLMADAIL